MNEHILEEAFHNSERVILIFSVNMSGFFQGYAQMMSSVGWRRDNVWTGLSGGSNPWGSTFKVKWLQLNNLPFQKTLHLKNPLNDYKPVKISRDCQELSPEIGEALCDLIDGNSNVNSTRKSNNFMDELLGKPCVESPEGYAHTTLPSHVEWLHPSLLYQNVGQPHTSDIQVQNRKFTAGSIQKKLARGMLRPTNDWQLSSKRCTIMDSLSEDDFLSMTYEEYLQQACGRNIDPSQYMHGSAPFSSKF
ncbi:hypothetical protein Syun_019065 [Stephania yunnanensis]|uniref:YTH domain-containing family protein n=1 Tax=Stephania yunnanensis TaxID=152371 RepID=A0AAP0NWC6_9MAGN